MKSSKIITEHKYTRWDTNKEGGWEEFKALTTANAILDEVSNEVNGDPDDMMIRIENEMNKVKFKAFGKVKIRNKNKSNKILTDLQNQKINCYEKMTNTIARDIQIEEIDKKLAETLLSDQRNNFEKEICAMKDLQKSKGKTALIFDLKNKVVGSKKTAFR